MFEAAGAVFNDETGYYEMNGLTDLTEDDILKSYKITANIRPTASNGNSVYNIGSFVNSSYRIRTNFPVQCLSRDFYEINLYCQNKLEVFTLLNDEDNTGLQPFYLRSGIIDGYNCFKLRKFIGILDVTHVKTGTVNGGTNSMTALQELNIKRIKVDCTIFQKTSVVSLDSLSFLVENADNTDLITVTVHPDVYAKLTDEANAEWYAVNTAAQAKNISFATTG